MSFKSVIFDWGGVLIVNPPAKIAEYVADYFGVSSKQVADAWRLVEDPFGRGAITECEMWGTVCTHLGVALPTTKSLYYDAFSCAYEEQGEMFELIGDLKQLGFAIGLLAEIFLFFFGLSPNCFKKFSNFFFFFL